jgi:dolichol-phosphate mannosyltransferase
MDADFSHQPEHLRDFFREIESKKWDSVCGSRYVPGGGVSNWDRSRLLLSRMGSVYARLWLWFDVKDWTGGFNAWRRDVLSRLDLGSIQSRGYTFQIEMKYRCLKRGFKLKEIPIIFQERRVGQSKMSGSIVKEALVGVIKLRFFARANSETEQKTLASSTRS